ARNLRWPVRQPAARGLYVPHPGSRGRQRASPPDGPADAGGLLVPGALRRASDDWLPGWIAVDGSAIAGSVSERQQLSWSSGFSCCRMRRPPGFRAILDWHLSLNSLKAELQHQLKLNSNCGTSALMPG